MSFELFTSVTGYPLQGIDLYLQSDTGAVLNTRSNLEVRHNETNRFFAIPYNAALTFNDLFNNAFNTIGSNFMYVATSSSFFSQYGRHFMISATLAARPLQNSGDYAFYVSTTTKAIDQGTFFSSPENSINYPQFVGANVGRFGSNVAQFVVTSMSSQVLDLSRASLAAGGDGSVPLVAQVMYVAGVDFGSNYVQSRFEGTVSTIFSQPFALTCVAPLHRTLAY
jgi:hypothetical protein